MIKTKTVSHIFCIAVFGMIISACTPKTGTSGLRGRNTSAQNITGANIALGQGYVLADNPIILAGNLNMDPNTNLNAFLSPTDISTTGFLKGTSPCDVGTRPCFVVQATNTSTVLQSLDGKWAYNYSTPEFLQVNTFYHLNKTIELFFNNLVAHEQANALFPSYDSAIPLSHTYNTISNGSTSNPSSTAITLKTFADCESADNASFDYANFTLCFGYLTANANIKFAQDSTIIYHEAGHFFQKLQLNFRNSSALGSASQPLPQTDMGNVFYTEAGAIGEGLSDFYSYYVNGRPHLGEWAAGRLLNASRPISESETIHAAGISTDPAQRLNYPTFLNYDANYPQAPIEDIHYAGMIISHYLVALAEDFQSYCGMSKQASSNMVTHLISETLAELGDLTTQGTNAGSVGKVNYNVANAKDWYRINNPITYRSFTQTFAKNLYQNMHVIPQCNSVPYGKDRIETLIDDYGLLLFRTYNAHKNQSNPSTKTNITVAPTNRKKSSLISKTLIKLDPTANASAAFVIDAQNVIADGVAQLTSTGAILGDLSQTMSGFPFNNGNSRVSPGEVVAIALNLYNDSNATMGGIQILANDWNHVDPASKKPYILEQWPLSSEGGTAAPAAVTENFSPVCLIQSKSTNGTATEWITQDVYRTRVAVDKTMCLDNTNSTTSDKDCFIRAVKGVDQANFSKLNPKSTWGQTMTDPQTTVAPSLSWSNVLLFQVSKHVPPGTVVNCRLRVRFTNCEECYHDSKRKDLTNEQTYDYLDLDYNGADPFKIINLQFSIID